MQNGPCEVVLIAGFLGAGKTTLLRNILGWPGKLSGTAILVNEFGKIGIDGQLLEGFDTPVVEMANGCICCSLQGDLIRTLAEILERFHPKRLFIEATGVADPLDILKVLNLPQFRQQLGGPKVVTVVDADFWEAKEYFGPLFYNQVKAAHLVLLNKVDLQEAEQVPRYLREIQEISPAGAVLPTHHCRIDPDVLWGLASPVERENQWFVADDLVPNDLFGHLREPSRQPQMKYVTLSFESATPFREECFRGWLASMPIELYRIKGYVLLGDRRVFLNHVGGKTEWAEAKETGPTRLALVGWQVDRQEILAHLAECLTGRPPLDGADMV
jgi:G3E family GTPase